MDAAAHRKIARNTVGVPSYAMDDEFDVVFAEELARLESYNKHHYRPNSYLHKWWARRCGSTFRLILKHLVEDEALRDYYVAGGLEGKVVLDPMMGGGTTLHEAIRMGASVVGVDVDPIPVLQAQASLTEMSLRALENAFRDLYDELNAACGRYWQSTCPSCDLAGPLRFVLYGARRHCRCGEVIIVDSLILRYEKRRIAFRLCPRCHDVLGEGQRCGCSHPDRAPIIEKGQTECARCGEPYCEDIAVPYYARFAPLAIAGHCTQHGLFFAPMRSRDLAVLAESNALRTGVYAELEGRFVVEPGAKARDLLNHGVRDFRDLFSSRQLLYLRHAQRILPQVEEVARLNLALLVSTSLEFNALLCGYKGGPVTSAGARPGAIRHAFSHHAYAFPYTALENNVLFPAKGSGTLQKLFHGRLRRARKWARQPRERRLQANGKQVGPRFVPIRGERDEGRAVQHAEQLNQQPRSYLVKQGSATSLPLPDDSVDFVVTDPPYYDNVQYSDLSAFFRVWLPALVGDREGPGCNWQYDLSQVAVDSLHNGNGQYGRVLGEIFAECHRVLKPGGRLIFTFHHWKPQGWAALTVALRQAAFRLVNRYVVHAENPISVHIANLRSISDDAILVLAPLDAGAHLSWQRPATIDDSDSAAFCRDSASLLGWMLEMDWDAAAIERAWREALREG